MKPQPYFVLQLHKLCNAVHVACSSFSLASPSGSSIRFVRHLLRHECQNSATICRGSSNRRISMPRLLLHQRQRPDRCITAWRCPSRRRARHMAPVVSTKATRSRGVGSSTTSLRSPPETRARARTTFTTSLLTGRSQKWTSSSRTSQWPGRPITIYACINRHSPNAFSFGSRSLYFFPTHKIPPLSSLRSLLLPPTTSHP
ncbi:hypothetical protein B0T16DRAFT_108075 [Cercophora newfieldiana]|uniref:Uncharacterized protein n=1 Tax=Cercophora newfieldiana TaxID=92897 RepID=A0AA40CW76_9PEZI|nr:hypothetical protein B0T16DRAFT_108075 [Cercophora newfieldiana]